MIEFTEKRLLYLLSSFTYKTIHDFIYSRSFKEKIKVYKVNPAYTTIIGKCKIAKRYGYSSHHSAAVIIARRVNRFSERPPRYLQDSKDDHGTFSLPVRNREKHVWSFWCTFNKMIAAHVAQAPASIRRSLERKDFIHETDIRELLRRNSLMQDVSNTA